MGLTQQTLADQLSCWLQTVSKWERDLSQPLAPHWGKIETVLGPGLVPERDELPGQIRAARLRHGLSQEELANLAGVHVRTVRNAETGTYGPSRVTLDKLRAIFGESF